MLKKLSILLILPLLLFGCAKKNYDVTKMQEYYTNLTAVTANVNISTNTGVLLNYSLTCEKSAELSKITITAPEPLSGISAEIAENGTKITYDSVMVETLLPSLQGFSPVDALDGVILDLRNSVPSDTLIGKEVVTLTYTKAFDGCDGEKRVYINRETMALEKAEFFLEDKLVMELGVSLFNPV